MKARRGQSLDLSDLVPLNSETENGGTSRVHHILVRISLNPHLTLRPPPIPSSAIDAISITIIPFTQGLNLGSLRCMDAEARKFFTPKASWFLWVAAVVATYIFGRVVNVPILLGILTVIFCVISGGAWRWINRTERRRKYFWVLFGLYAVTTVSLTTWYLLHPESLIKIQPVEEFSLREGPWSNTRRVVVTNIGSTAFYAVWVKILVRSPGISSDQIKIGGEIDAEAPKAQLGEVLLSTDGFGFFGVDRDGHEAVLVRLYRVGGKDRTIDVSTTASANCSVVASIVGFKLSPEPITEGLGGAGFQVTLPETFQARGQLFSLTNTGVP